MSEQNTTETQTQTPADGIQGPWKDKFTKLWFMTHLGHRGMMLDKITRQNKIVELTARNAATGKTTDISGWPEDEELGVSIGNETHNHYEGRPPQTLAAKLLPFALAAIFGGGGAMLATYLLNRDPPAAVDTDTDNVNRYDVGFGEPVYKE